MLKNNSCKSMIIKKKIDTIYYLDKLKQMSLIKKFIKKDKNFLIFLP